MYIGWKWRLKSRSSLALKLKGGAGLDFLHRVYLGLQ